MNIRSTVIKLSILFCVAGIRYKAVSQPTNTQLAASLAAVQQQYNSSFAVNPQLYNGPEYVDYAKRYKRSVGHQFFLSSEKQSGSLYYNDHLFTGLSMLYDVVLGQLVLQHATSPLYLKIINENVRHFTIADHRFIRLVADSSASSLIQTGYYEVLVDTTLKLLAKRAKKAEKKIEQDDINIGFQPADKLFIRKGGVDYAINKNRSIVQLFADHGKEVQKYIQDNRLRFKKKQLEANIVQLTRYYAGLLAR